MPRIPPFKARSFLSSLLLVAAASGLGACTNRGSTVAVTKGSSANSLSSIPGSGGGGAPTSAITLSSVLRSQADPNGKLDLLGDGSGAIQNFCNPEGKPAEDSLCQCVLGYIDGSGNSLQLAVTPSHIESDLIRCSYTGVPGTVTQLSVKIYFTPADLSSNSYNFSFSTAVGGASLSDISAYTKPTRFQCKSHIYISHFGDDSNDSNGSSGSNSIVSLMYDPIQSEDPRLSYGFNFYTSNPGGAVALYASQNASQQRLWECPLDLTSGSPLGLDYSVFSLQSDGQSSRIYPAAGSVFDRSTFLTARQKNGIFNVPINAPLMPGLPNQIPDADGKVGAGVAPVLGWGVQPVPAAGNENCPGANVSIPSGHHWAKLWLFRGSLPVRYAKASPTLSLTPIACNPGNFLSDSGLKDKPYITDCADPSKAGSGPVPDCSDTGCIGMNYKFGTAPLVDRIAQREESNGTPRNRCMKVTKFGLGNPTIAAGQTSSSTGLLAGYTEFGLGTDIWSPRHEDQVSANPNSCSQTTNKFDPLNLCSTPDPTTLTGESAANAANAKYVPHVSSGVRDKLSNVPIDTNDGGGFSSRSDYIFVVTPASVSAAQMDAQGSQVANMYTPYRFIPSTACQSGNPDLPAFAGDCHSRYRVQYLIERHDITQAGSTSSNFIYPVCVLQPD